MGAFDPRVTELPARVYLGPSYPMDGLDGLDRACNWIVPTNTCLQVPCKGNENDSYRRSYWARLPPFGTHKVGRIIGNSCARRLFDYRATDLAYPGRAPGGDRELERVEEQWGICE